MPLPTLQESTSEQTKLLSELHVDNCLSGVITCIHYPLFYYSFLSHLFGIKNREVVMVICYFMEVNKIEKQGQKHT